MSAFPGFPRHFRLPWRSQEQIRDEVGEEVAFHLEMRTDELITGGMEPGSARAEAEREFGDLEQAEEALRQADGHIERARRRIEWLRDMTTDLRFAWRALGRAPGVVGSGVLTLALGVGASTLLFSLVSALLLQPLPYPNPDRLVALSHQYPDLSRTQVSPANFRDYATRVPSLASLGGFAQGSTVYLGPDRPESLDAMYVTEGFFPTLEGAPLLGRALLPGDFASDANLTVVLSERVWRRHFGGDPGLVGRTIRLANPLADGPATVVGIYPGHAHLPGDADVWQPLRLPAAWYSDGARGQAEMLDVIGRLRPGASLEQARVELDRVADDLRARFPAAFGEASGWQTRLGPLREAVVGETRSPLLFLLGASLFVLGIACANVANLLLVRAISRRREIAIRSALGGGAMAVARPLLLEAVLLGVGGVALGALLALAGIQAFHQIVPDSLARAEGVRLDGRVFAFAVCAGLGASLLAGIAPLRRLAGMRPSTVLGNDGRSASRTSPWRTQRLLVVTTFALTFALLVGAGLMTRSMLRLNAVELGFRPQGVLTAEIDLSSATAPEARNSSRFFELLSERIQARPGATAVGATLAPPLIGFRWKETIGTEDAWRGSAGARLPEVEVIPVTDGYFAAAGVPLLAGRAFDERDRADSTPVAVVSRALAARSWPGENPVGKRIALNPDWSDSPEWVTVVGVAGDVRTESVAQDPGAAIYYPIEQNSGSSATLFIRSDLEPDAAAALVREEVRRLDPGIPVHEVQAMPEVVARTIGPRKLAFWIAAAFAACSLVLAALGLYGVVSFLVRSRTPEFGIRIALGARQMHILRLVLRQAGGASFIGLLVGLPLALSVAALLRGYLFGVSTVDPLTYGAFSMLLAAVVMLAAILPARRAARVDPQVALRAE